MSESITNQGSQRVSVRITPVEVQEARVRDILPGETVHRGDIPDDAFDHLRSLPTFGADLEEYRAARARRWDPKPEATPLDHDMAASQVEEED